MNTSAVFYVADSLSFNTICIALLNVCKGPFIATQLNSTQRLRCFIHRLISPMHRTDVCVDASNFQPMNGIKQHLGVNQSYDVTFVLI